MYLFKGKYIKNFYNSAYVCKGYAKAVCLLLEAKRALCVHLQNKNIAVLKSSVSLRTKG